MSNNGANTNSTNNSTTTSSPTKRSTKKFFFLFLAATAAIATFLAVTEIFGFLIETFASIPLLFKITLAACFVIAAILMAIFCKRKKGIVLLIWTLTAMAIYLAYAIYLFPAEFVSNLYFPSEFAGGYFLSFIVALFCYLFAFDIFKKKK